MILLLYFLSPRKGVCCLGAADHSPGQFDAARCVSRRQNKRAHAVSIIVVFLVGHIHGKAPPAKIKHLGLVVVRMFDTLSYFYYSTTDALKRNSRLPGRYSGRASICNFVWEKKFRVRGATGIVFRSCCVCIVVCSYAPGEDNVDTQMTAHARPRNKQT